MASGRKPDPPPPTPPQSFPGPLPATTLPKPKPGLANVPWPGALAENLMIHIGSLGFEQVHVYFLILVQLGAKSQGANM